MRYKKLFPSCQWAGYYEPAMNFFCELSYMPGRQRDSCSFGIWCLFRRMSATRFNFLSDKVYGVSLLYKFDITSSIRQHKEISSSCLLRVLPFSFDNSCRISIPLIPDSISVSLIGGILFLSVSCSFSHASPERRFI